MILIEMLFSSVKSYLFLASILCFLAVEKAENVTSSQRIKKFYVSLDKANYYESFVHCKQGGMQLASIENEDESAALDTFLDPYKMEGWINGFWLSGTHLIDTSSFQYYWLSTGARTIFTNWSPGQPDNSGGKEHCMQWGYIQNLTAKPIGWNDWSCENTIRYVCEHISYQDL